VSSGRAFAKINLGLVVGPLRADGRHEILTVLQRIDLHDDVELEVADELVVDGFDDDTIVHDALTELAAVAGVGPRWRVRLEKRIPVAAGLGGGSADGAAALRLANATLPHPLPRDELHRIAAGVGADMPFFLREGAQLATGDGTDLTTVSLPGGYHIALVVPSAETKSSTGAVYDAFDARAGAEGFEARRQVFRDALTTISSPPDLAALPANDLATSPLAAELRSAGAFRADVSGAGPAVYGLFEDDAAATAAAKALEAEGRTFVTRPLGPDAGPVVAR
jgi:4-diphosphocytidyl-2-C-methyl-D-erythritol kinase